MTVHVPRTKELERLLAGKKLVEKKEYNDLWKFCKENEREGHDEDYLFDPVGECADALDTEGVYKIVVEKYDDGTTVYKYYREDTIYMTGAECVDVVVVGRTGKTLYRYDCNEYFRKLKLKKGYMKEIGEDFLVVTSYTGYGGGYIYVITPKGCKVVVLDPRWWDEECEEELKYGYGECEPSIPGIWNIDDSYATVRDLSFEEFLDEMNRIAEEFYETISLIDANTFAKYAKRYGYPDWVIKKYMEIYRKYEKNLDMEKESLMFYEEE